MSWRFRRRPKLFRGLHLNISKPGYSISVGEKGLTTNISRRGLRETFSAPGTGLSYQSKTYRPGQHHNAPKRPSPQSISSGRFLMFIAGVVIILWILAHLH